MSRKLELHDLLVRKTAVKTMLMEGVVETILSHEKKGVNMALRTLNEVEISGFGKLYLSQVKLRNRLKYLETAIEKTKAKLLLLPTDGKLMEQLEWMERDFAELKTKVIPDEDRLQGTDGGGEEHILPSLGDQGGD